MLAAGNQTIRKAHLLFFPPAYKADHTRISKQQIEELQTVVRAIKEHTQGGETDKRPQWPGMKVALAKGMGLSYY